MRSRNTNCKLFAVRRTNKYLTAEKTKLVGNIFIDSLIKYAPFNLKFFSRKVFPKKIKGAPVYLGSKSKKEIRLIG